MLKKITILHNNLMIQDTDFNGDSGGIKIIFSFEKSFVNNGKCH